MILKLCIGGDLDGMTVDLNKKNFKAGEIDTQILTDPKTVNSIVFYIDLFKVL